MVAYKAARVSSFLSSPPSGICAALLYGPDPALVSDNAASLAKKIAVRSDPPGDIVRLGERELADNPGRLGVEARTLSMFSGPRVIRAEAGQRFPLGVMEELLAGPIEAFVIAEAGNLRPDAALRRQFEASDSAAALPCYELGRRDMTAFIDARLAERGVTIDTAARDHLASLFGGDQARARAELAKLALYAGDGGTIGMEDIDAAIGDAARSALDTFSVATAGRDSRDALCQLDRLIAAGQSPQGAIAALGRHFDRLHRLCAALEAGEDAKAALGRFRPPLHFRQRDALEAQARNWSRQDVARVLRRTEKAVRMARLQPELERQITERLVISIAR